MAILKIMEEKIIDLKLTELEKLLNQCTRSQKHLFEKIFPGGIKKIPEDEINAALQLCERTVKSNSM